MSKIRAICISAVKNVPKEPVREALFETEWGIAGDAHAGRGHKQISLLGHEEIKAFRRRGLLVKFGAFGENLVVDAFDFDALPVGTRLRTGNVWLEITQIARTARDGYGVLHENGETIMPRVGAFARVLHGGMVKTGDDLVIAEGSMPLDAAILATEAAHKAETDRAIAEFLERTGFTVVAKTVLSGEQAATEAKLQEYADIGVGLAVTIGGIGFEMQDTIPEATLAVMERSALGIAEAIRAHAAKDSSQAMLLRTQAGITKRTILANLPSDVKAAENSLAFVLPILRTGIQILRGEKNER